MNWLALVLVGASVSVSFGPGTGPIHVTNLQCEGTEPVLAFGPASTESSDLSRCTHANDASVRCILTTCMQIVDN